MLVHQRRSGLLLFKPVMTLNIGVVFIELHDTYMHKKNNSIWNPVCMDLYYAFIFVTLFQCVFENSTWTGKLSERLIFRLELWPSSYSCSNHVHGPMLQCVCVRVACFASYAATSLITVVT